MQRSSIRVESREWSRPEWIISAYLRYPSVLQWQWSDLTSATMVGPGSMHLTGRSVNGEVSWLLESDWSELAFILWALERHPAHPQLLGGGWLPPGWVHWAAFHHHPIPTGVPGLAPNG